MLYEAVRSELDEKSRPTFEVTNPATGQKIADVPFHSPEHVAEAVKRARVAQKEWGALTYEERARHLFAVRRTLLENKERMLQTIVAETGKPRPEVLIELMYISDMIGYYGKNARKFLPATKTSFHLYKNKKGFISYHPYGVVGIISPWNFPLVLSFGDAICALMAGNSVVIKPSEFTPLTSLLMAEFFEMSGVSENVVQIVTGIGETATALIDEADIISFTGSVATGRKVMERAAKTLKPVLLELGGKDPMIVLRDAELNRAVGGAVNGGMFNAGQMCISVELVYVEEAIYDMFVSRVVEEVKKLRLGVESVDGNGQMVDMGPLMSERQLEIVERQVEDARAKGATILTGGKRRTDLGSLFYEPTVITNVTDDMLLMQEETFGPVLPILKVKSAEEAIRRSNSSRFGLSSSIWTRDTARGVELARTIEAGSTCINDVAINYVIPEVPMGAIKDSGIGHRHGGADGIRLFCRSQSIVTNRFGMKREFYWYPYSRKVEKLLIKGLDLLFKR